MSLRTNARSESSPSTLSFRFERGGVDNQQAATKPDPLTIVCIDGSLVAQKLPDGYVGMDALRARRARNPTRLAAVESARQRIAGFIRGSGDETLKSFRLSHGLSQQDFASRLGTTQPYLSRIEHNPSSAGIDFMRRLCSEFGIDMNQANELLR
jgi:DNA-binding XRE family transcriptional regulator